MLTLNHSLISASLFNKWRFNSAANNCQRNCQISVFKRPMEIQERVYEFAILNLVCVFLLRILDRIHIIKLHYIIKLIIYRIILT